MFETLTVRVTAGAVGARGCAAATTPICGVVTTGAWVEAEPGAGPGATPDDEPTSGPRVVELPPFAVPPGLRLLVPGCAAGARTAAAGRVVLGACGCGAAASRRTSLTISVWPALMRLRAIGPPMFPSPMNPIRMVCVLPKRSSIRPENTSGPEIELDAGMAGGFDQRAAPRGAG